ncbi:unnamed protein product [Protopolystoma xenopodis]|uniref:Uncharacterized protein n=1 Tax=Protopolystoma xenopodis TaxID=117903 RepID=A0A3S5AC93_9PLAT|nr:unnamed protein product [Protopolystoma xenopodis]
MGDFPVLIDPNTCVNPLPSLRKSRGRRMLTTISKNSISSSRGTNEITEPVRTTTDAHPSSFCSNGLFELLAHPCPGSFCLDCPDSWPQVHSREPSFLTCLVLSTAQVCVGIMTVFSPLLIRSWGLVQIMNADFPDAEAPRGLLMQYARRHYGIFLELGTIVNGGG